MYHGWQYLRFANMYIVFGVYELRFVDKGPKHVVIAHVSIVAVPDASSAHWLDRPSPRLSWH